MKTIKRVISDSDIRGVRFAVSECKIRSCKYNLVAVRNDYFNKTDIHFESWLTGKVKISSKCGIEISFNWIAIADNPKKPFIFHIKGNHLNTALDINVLITDRYGDKLEGDDFHELIEELLYDAGMDDCIDSLAPTTEDEFKNLMSRFSCDEYIDYTGDRVLAC
ncbi:hypothetical protein KCM76_23070 [Zooshikella marina]|uniref:hypothetical protein n=1 Tax=Zooshikella ganghwensis TaxID=202772 RepID=UPI001BAEAE3B|nr:hypothetical protein [Zooshikella ganghwensis]MBU2708895.1 hypothetical protein [Zooshikella ganghwensis]